MEYPKTVARLEQVGIFWHWVMDCCPLCGELHVHGGGRKLLGHRVAHCVERKEPGGYILVELVGLELAQVEILAGRDTLVIQAEREIAVGDILQVGDIKVEVTKATPLEDFGRFNWEVCIRGDVSKLRGRLTYIVG